MTSKPYRRLMTLTQRPGEPVDDWKLRTSRAVEYAGRLLDRRYDNYVVGRLGDDGKETVLFGTYWQKPCPTVCHIIMKPTGFGPIRGL